MELLASITLLYLALYLLPEHQPEDRLHLTLFKSLLLTPRRLAGCYLLLYAIPGGVVWRLLEPEECSFERVYRWIFSEPFTWLHLIALLQVPLVFAMDSNPRKYLGMPGPLSRGTSWTTCRHRSQDRPREMLAASRPKF